MCNFMIIERICYKCGRVQSTDTRFIDSCTEVLAGNPCRGRDDVKEQVPRAACLKCFTSFVVKELVEEQEIADNEASGTHTDKS